MERMDNFDHWVRFLNRDVDTSSFESNQMDERMESSSRTTDHVSNRTGSNQMDAELESSPRFTGHQTDKRRTGTARNVNESTCERLANIIGGEVISAAPVCVVMRLRNINATILGRRTRSPLALPFMLSFENNGLNLGESVVRQRELNPFIASLRKRGLIVTAFHNHWLFENPRLMYIHWENVGMSAEEFARNSIAAAREAGLF
ncbi:DUF1259 domain-containing protein [Bacillus sp. MM2020_4]|uniref:DUF1259 domain-containing protein n=1 Tax=Bacillaceae TaxID=186817 RepID=UPI00325B827E